MDARTYRASSMQEALALVRRELGPDACVLHTRELGTGVLGWFGKGRQIEITASNTVSVPSRLPEAVVAERESRPPSISPAHEQNFGAKFRRDLAHQLTDLDSMIEDLCRENDLASATDLPPPLFELLRELLAADVPETQARELI